jgi:hypothetical protein
MAERPAPIATIRLARGRVRLAGAPVAFLLVGAAAAAAGVVAGGPGRIALVALAALAALVAVYLLALVSSYRLLVEPGGLLLRWFGGERRYRLVRGSITRVALAGRGGAALHPRFAALGWAVGPAILRGEEPIELIRLSTRVPMILVPTDRGRLAVAAQVESDLLEALGLAVRVQERIDEVASRRAAPQASPPTIEAGRAVPRILTGIERSLIEQRLAAERAAALAVAETEREAASALVTIEATSASAAQPVAPVVAPVVAAVAAPTRPAVRRRERAPWRRPAWLAVPGPASVVAALPIAAPLVGAAIAWFAVAITGRPALPLAESRLLLAALILVGPLGAVAALIARAWYPRIGGLVAASSLTALAMLARTILA